MSQHAARARDAARQAGDDDRLETVARIGYATNGVVHLLLAWIAVQVAWTGGGEDADQSGAMALLAKNAFGKGLLWLCVLGFAGLAVWQVTEAVRGGSGQGSDQAKARAKAAGKAVVYAALGVSAARFAVGSGSSSKQQSTSLTGRLLEAPGGQVLVALVGLGVLAVGAYHVVKGVRKKFLDDLRGHPGRTVERLAVAGYVAKGVALGVLGVLFVVAAVQHDPKEAGGLDAALKTLREQPSGPVLLTLVGLGIAAYGLYSFARSRYARL
ncbi:DUF1206 domain-containing protein [Angustibacter aerolatus]|uniref:Membrane protein n=1 Tax=Angustibacter aerolatus TaxID=1162965 RepID=A0ABQ6JN48_9ACTN|nr:DUF1206 domain-containing protein [Angustibacter aerolatus]GMA89197.1 membrane protein [Angustibacter aerolatus]